MRTGLRPLRSLARAAAAFALLAAPLAGRAQETLTIADGSDPVASPICPSASVAVDAFTMQASSGTANVTGVTVVLGPADVYQDVWSVRVDCGAANGTATSPTSSTVAVAIAVSVGTSPTTCSVTLTPRDHGTLTAVGNLPVQAIVTNATVPGYTVGSTDSSNGFTIDNAPPAAIAALTAAPADAQVALSWTNPPTDHARTILVRKESAAVTFVPADGTDYLLGPTPVPGETVIYASNGTSHADSPLSNGTTYHYKAVARDACSNWSVASIANATPLPFVGDGDLAAGSEKPVLSILNPANGAVLTLNPEARVQIRAFSPGSRDFVAPGVELLVNGTAKSTTKLASYSPTAYSGVWEYRLSAADGLAAGATVTLRARASNTAGGPVYSGEITVRIAPGGKVGDGNLLVRDNASQLCTDCHALQSHSSESVGNAKGSWSMTCRDCHAPHGTRNLGLIAEQVTPPARTAPQSAKTVVYYNRSGWGASSYAGNARTGPCQVCHTRTNVYRSDGTDVDPDTGATIASGDHYPTSKCASCHLHSTGFVVACTDCHGTEGRLQDTSVAGTVDPRLEAAPPVDTDKPPNPANDALRVGAHEAHVNRGTYRTNALRCADCHPNPPLHQGTRDAGWSELATTGTGYTLYPAAGSYAAWESSPTCTNWCHGAGLAGGGGTRPSGPNWTLGAQEAQCGTCHASPPPVDSTAAKDHPQNNACATCHGPGYAQASLDPTAKTTHIDGRLQKPQNGCSACHGKLTGLAGTPVGSTSPQAAPGYDALSYDTHGSNDRAQIGVGAHGRHVNDGFMAAKACIVCHPHPADGDTSHANAGATQMAWAAPANSGGVTPGYTQPNCTNYCHSTGDPLGVTTAVTTQISWLSQTTLGCTSCHAKAAIATNAHDVHVGTLGKSCSLCHFDTTIDGNTIPVGEPHHVNGANDVQFDGGDALVTGGGYTRPTCSNIYCHSNGNPAGGSISYRPASWTETYTPNACNQCHDTATTLVTNAHEQHLNNLALNGLNYVCADCHRNVVASGNMPITTAANHVNGTKQIEIANRGTISSTEVYAANSCDTTYCHSDGRRGDSSNFTFRTVVWTGAPWGAGTQCYRCHGTGTTTGAPDYGGAGTANTRNANSHGAHVASGVECTTCHLGFVNASGTAIPVGSSHTNGAINVSFDNAQAGAVVFVPGSYSPPLTYTSATCANVKCHGKNVVPLLWGGAVMTCASCHLRTTAQGGDDDNWLVNDDNAAMINSDEYAAVGHGAVPAIAVTEGCLYCHDDTVVHGDLQTPSLWNPFRLRGLSNASGATGAYNAMSPSFGNDICINCHDADAGARNGVDPDGPGGMPQLEASTRFVDAWHFGTDHTTTQNGGKRCWDCHDPHGDGSNLAMIGRDTLRSSSDDFGYVGTRSPTAAVLTVRGAGGYANNTTFDGICQVCHTTTSYWRAGTVEPDHAVGTSCVSCHTHQQPPSSAFQGGGACSNCHLATASPGAPSDRDEFPPSTTVGGKSYVDREDWFLTGHGTTGTYSQSGNPGAAFPAPDPVQGIDPCYYCHAPEIALFVGGETSTHADVAAADPFRLVNTSNGANPNGVCLVCHAPSSAGFDPDGGANPKHPGLNRTTSKAISATHHGADHGSSNDGGSLCWDCHDPHGDYNYGTGREIAYMIQARPTKDSTNAWGSAGTFAANDVDFNKATGGVGTALEGADYVISGSPWNGVCQVCHTSTNHWTSTGGGTGHQNGTARCVSCHDHQQTPDFAFRNVDPASCGACHPSSPAGGRHASHLGAPPASAYSDPAFLSSPTEYNFGCGQCHAAPPAAHLNHGGGTSGTPYRAEISLALGGSYPALVAPVATETGATGLYFGWQDGTCSSTYCHDPLGAAYEGPAVSWNTAATVTCTMCHDDGTNQASTALPPAHGKHVLASANLGYQYVCQQCHANTVDALNNFLTGPGLGKAKHVNNDKNDVKFAPAGPVAQPNGIFSGGPTGTCSATYCHSDGKNQSGTFNPPAVNLQWNQTGNCTSCHAGGGGPSTTLSGAHFRHVDSTANDGYGYGCERCHSATWSGMSIVWSGGVTQHVDGDVNGDVTFNGAPIAQPAATYVSATERCNSTYCHSNGQSATSPFGGTDSIAWTTSGGCDKCHGVGGATTTTLGSSHAKHVTNAAGVRYAYSCEKCHVPTVSDSSTISSKANHVDADFTTRDVGFSTWPLDQRELTGSSYDVGTKRCGNTYCHSNGQDRVSPFGQGASTLAWGGSNADCTGCHYGNVTASLVLASNAHGAHVANTASSPYIQRNVGCAVCHNGTASDDRTILDPQGFASHVNGQAEAFGYVDGTSDELANGSCASNYCHSSGSGSVQYYPATWNTALPNDCKQCHGRYTPQDFASVAGEPNHANGGAGDADANSHQAHVTLADGTECYRCHKDTVASTGNKIPSAAANHLDGNADVSLDTANARIGGSATYTAGKTCNNVICHGGTGSSVQWGGSVTCRSCHMKSGAGDLDTDDYTYDNNVVAAVDQEDWLAYGHGAPLPGTYAESGNPKPNFDNAGGPPVDGCLYCHGDAAGGGAGHDDPGNPFRLKNTTGPDGKLGVCLECHKSGGPGVTVGGQLRNRTTSEAITATHYGADHATGGRGGAFCWDCHDPHGDYNAVGRPIAYMIHEFPTVTHSGPAGWGVPTATASFAVDFVKATPGSDLTAFDALDYVRTSGNATGVCQVCHTATQFWRSDGTQTNHNGGGAKCVACHRHQQPATDAFKQATTCDACHAAPPANGKHAVHVGASTPAYGDTAAHSTAGAYAYGCGKCHATPSSVHWDDVGGTASDPFVADVYFDWVSGVPSYSPGTGTNYANPTSGLVFRTTTGTCATYCHSDGQPLGASAPTYRSPVWNAGASSMTCTSCHGGDEGSGTPLGTGKHPQHITTANPVGTGYGCTECHGNVVSGAKGSETISDRTLHVNGGAKNVAFVTKNGQTSAAYASPSCSSNYCHSNGRDPSFTDPARYADVAWNQAPVLGCNGCHGIGQAYGMPNYPDGATLPEANSHLIHTANGTDATRCEHCHTNTVPFAGTSIKASAPHTDGFRNVSILAAYDSDANATNNYNVTTKQCSGVTCHGTAATPVWGNALACDACHGAPPAAPNAGAHAKHEGAIGALPTQYNDTSRNGPTKYGIACSTCHAGTHNSDADGSPWIVDITAGLNYTGTGTTVDKVELNGQTFRWTNNKSCATDCHSDGGRMLAGGGYTAPNRINPTGWNVTLGCTGCHGGGGATTTLSLAHLKHIDSDTYGMKCVRCHADTVTADPWPITSINANGYDDHVNGSRSWKFDSYLAGNGTDTINNTDAQLLANHTCTSTYCHSNGQTPTAPYTSTSAAWTESFPAGVCTQCHGGSSGTLMSSGSHTAHIGAPNGYRCAVCHSTVVGALDDTTILAGGYSLHVDGTPNVVISSTYGGTFNPVTHQCSNVSCHGGGTPTWGTATSVTCRTCHGKALGGDDDADHWTFASPIGSGIVSAANPMSKIDIDDWTSYGHGRTSALGNYAQSNNASAKLDGATSGMNPSQDGCRYCHAPVNGTGAVEHDTTMGTNPFRLISTTPKNQVCLNCHDPGVTGSWAPPGSGLTAITTISKINALHAGGDHAATDAGNFCWDCHDPHGDYRYTATQQQIAYMFQEFPTTANSGATGWGIPTAVAGTAVDFRYNKDGSGSAGVFSWGDYAAASPYNGACQVCHTGTSRMLANGSTWANDQNHYAGQTCTTSCHRHQQPPTDAFKAAAGDCKGCHLDPQGARRQVVAKAGAGGDFQGRSHHVSNGTATEVVENWDCLVCHAEGKMALTGTETDATGFHGNGTVDLLNVDSAQAWRGAGNDPAGTVGTDRWVYNKVDGISATERADLDKFCLNCHDVNGALYTYNMNPANTAWHPATPSGASNAGTVRPFGASDTVTSANDGTIRPPTASVGGQTRGTVVNVKAQFDPAGSKQAGVWTKFSYHALVFFGVSRYNSTPANGIPGWTAGNNCNGAACNDQSLMYCSDCHLSMYNSHGSQNADYMLKCFQAGGASTCTADSSDSLGHAVGNRDGVCYRCHASGTYSDGASPTHAPANGGDFSEQFGTTPGTRQTSSGNLFGLGCMNCHGGTTFGAIHGSSETITPVANQTAYTRKAWRFMNGAAHSEWRSDNASTTSDTGDPTQDNARWSGRTWNCYTLGTNPDRSPAYSSCTQHKTGGKTGAGATRTLNY